MGQCNIDHSLEDVRSKFESQQQYLPETLVNEWMVFLQGNLSQSVLNEAFHLLKKYDLASKSDQQSREQHMRQMFESRFNK